MDEADAALGAAAEDRRGRSLSARSQAFTLRCCEPTWNETPCATRPSRWACSSTSTAISGSQPNLRDSGHSAPAQSDRMRQNTLRRARRGRSSRPRRRSRPRTAARRAQGARDVALLLDRVAVGDAVGRRAGGQRHLDLGDGGGVEARAQRGEQRQHLRRRVRLHRVEHPGVRQRLGEGQVVVAHDVEVDDQARPVVVRRLRRNSRMRAVMALSPTAQGRRTARCCGHGNFAAGARWGRDKARALDPLCCLGLEWESPFRTAGNEGQASSVATPAVEGRQRPRKPAPSLL